MMTINELIKELKGNKITHAKLSKVCKFISGDRITKDELIDDGKYPIISGGENIMGYTNKFNFDGNNITICRYGKAGYVSYHVGKIWVNDVAWVLKIIDPNQIDVKFLYYLLKSFQEKLYSFIIEGTIPPHISSKDLYNLDIYFPSLPYQQQIVKILDDFTELEAELEARKKQYDYWLNYLLNPMTLDKNNKKK